MSKTIATWLMLMVFVLSSCLFDRSGPGEDSLVDPNGVEPEESHAPWPFVADYQQSECYRDRLERCRGSVWCRGDIVLQPFCRHSETDCHLLSCDLVESTYTECTSCGWDWFLDRYVVMPDFKCTGTPCFATVLEDELRGDLTTESFHPTFVVGVRIAGGRCSFSGLCAHFIAAFAIDPHSGTARHIGELQDWLDSLGEDEPIRRVCGSFREDEFDPSMLVASDDGGMSLDMRSEKQRGETYGRNNRIRSSSIFGSHAGRVIDTEGNERPVFFEFVPPQPRDGLFSTKLEGCPFCPAIDEVEIEDEMMPYHFGYFPIVMSETFSSSEWLRHVEQGEQSVLAEMGLHECDAYPFADVPCWDRDHLATELVCLDEPDETYAVLVGKWMAPFCEGFGLPRGILRHLVRLRDGAVRLVDWHPFTEEVWNNPWHMYPRDYAFEGTRIRVRGGVPSDCSGWLRNALEIELPSGEELVVDLPLRE